MSFIKKLFRKNKKDNNPLEYLKKKYTNSVEIFDIDKRKITIKIRDVGNDRFFLIIENEDGKSFVFDQDSASFLGAIISDYVENGNLNIIEDILQEAKDDTPNEGEIDE